MKKAFLYNGCMILLILLIVPASCLFSQPFHPVKGSGMPVDRSFKVSDFHGIDVSGGFDVILVQGNSDDLTLTAQENLFENITVKVDQGILRIYTENNIMPTKPMKAHISFKNIDNLEVSGDGDIECETPVNVLIISVLISGGGDLNAAINTNELKCNISGGGDAEINGNIKNYTLDLSGGGDVNSTLDADIIDCSVAGGGDITFRGKGWLKNL